MNPLVLAVVVALLVPLLTRGSYRALATSRWDFVGILLGGLGLQILLDLDVVGRSHWHDIGFGVLVTSYVLVVAFCVANLTKPGMGVVLVGVLMNALAIVVNQGMAVDVPDTWLEDGRYTETVKHHLQSDEDTLIVLTDIIPLPEPFVTVISFGDLVIVVGLVDAMYHASRRRRPLAGAPVPAEPEGAEHPPEEERFETDDVGALLRITDAYLASYDERATSTTPGAVRATPAERGAIDAHDAADDTDGTDAADDAGDPDEDPRAARSAESARTPQGRRGEGGDSSPVPPADNVTPPHATSGPIDDFVPSR